MATLVTLALGAHAAGLGKLTVFSAIGQPLNAEVAIAAQGEEMASLSARLASPEAFKEAGIDFASALTGLRFRVDKSIDGQPVLRMTTDAPLNEPFLHFLLELDWTSGRMVREYTFLLDPPEMLATGRMGVSPVPQPVAPPVARPLPAPPIALAAAREAPAVPTPSIAPATPTTDDRTNVKVVSGDTLSKIAREHMPASVSLDQMLVALFNKNPDAFDAQNMNRLRAGKILRLPDETDVKNIPVNEARRVVIGQARDFNAYRRHLAEAAGAARPISDADPARQSGGKIDAVVDAPARSADARDKLEVSRQDAANLMQPAANARLEEELVARDKSLREASDRIALLEKNLANLKNLVELKSKSGTELQQQAQSVTPVQPQPAQDLKAPPVEAADNANKPVRQEASAKEPTPPAPSAPSAPSVSSPPATETPSPPPAPKQPVAPALAPPTPVEPPDDFLADNPELVLAGGGILALLLSYAGLTVWRKKKQSNASSQSKPALNEPAIKPVVAAATPAAVEIADADDVSILGDFSESSAFATEENVDPVAEADVLMAYGRDAQAEEILLAGLAKEPERAAIHLKLLELYANRQDVDKLTTVAAKLKQLTSPESPEWKRASALAAGLGVAVDTDGSSLVRHGKLQHENQAVDEGADESGGGVAEAADLPNPAAVMETLVLPVAVAADVADISSAEQVHADGSLDFDLDLGSTSMPPAQSVAAAADEAPAADEAMSLDFDFDLGSTTNDNGVEDTSQVEASAPEQGLGQADVAVTPAADEEEVAAIEFDFDIGGGEALPPVLADHPVEAAVGSGGLLAEAAADSAPAGMPPVSADMDFDLDLSDELADGAPAGPSASTIPAENLKQFDEDAPLSLSALELDFDLELDAPSLPSEAPPESPRAATLAAATSDGAGMADLALDLPALDAVADRNSENSVLAMELPDLELGERVGDANRSATSRTNAEAGSIDAVADESESFEVPDASAVEEAAGDPEVATKLELAQAYEEMGDREGARELLNEVLNEGSASQQALARVRLGQLES